MRTGSRPRMSSTCTSRTWRSRFEPRESSSKTVGSVRTGMSRSRHAVTTLSRSSPGRRGDGDDHLVRLGVVQDPRQVVGGPVHAIARTRACRCLRGSSSMKPITALESSGLRRSSQRHLLAAVAGAHDQDLGLGPLNERLAQRALDRRAHQEAGAGDEGQREQEVQRDDAARRVGVRGREQEQQPDQHEARDHDRLDDRLEVRLVDEPPQLRVQAEGGEQRELDRHHERDGAGAAGPRSGPGCPASKRSTNAR